MHPMLFDWPGEICAPTVSVNATKVVNLRAPREVVLVVSPTLVGGP